MTGDKTRSFLIRWALGCAALIAITWLLSPLFVERIPERTPQALWEEFREDPNAFNRYRNRWVRITGSLGPSSEPAPEAIDLIYGKAWAAPEFITINAGAIGPYKRFLIRCFFAKTISEQETRELNRRTASFIVTGRVRELHDWRLDGTALILRGCQVEWSK